MEAQLNEKPDSSLLLNPGDYYWFVDVKEFPVLEMCCPFCGSDAMFPALVRFSSIKPLTAMEKLACGFCGVRFLIREGMAVKL